MDHIISDRDGFSCCVFAIISFAFIFVLQQKFLLVRDTVSNSSQNSDVFAVADTLDDGEAGHSPLHKKSKQDGQPDGQPNPTLRVRCSRCRKLCSVFWIDLEGRPRRRSSKSNRVRSASGSWSPRTTCIRACTQISRFPYVVPIFAVQNLPSALTPHILQPISPTS